MSRHQSGYYDFNLGGFMFILVLFGIAIGVLVTFVLPKIWEWVKPLIHAATA